MEFMMANDPLDDELDWATSPQTTPSEPRLYQHLIRQTIEKSGPRPAICVSPDTTVRASMTLMKKHGMGCVLVVEDGRLTGIFTERDVLFRIIGSNRDPAALPVRDVMTPDPEALTMKDELAWVLNMMAVGGFRHVPIVDENHRPVAVFSVKHIVERLVEFFPNAVLNLPPRPGKNIARSREGA